ncbi:uncharacterized protein EDB91DRAFT_1102913 [Suillus paluster]|uniref:uncharacterized protein n=1 Tax=Suillus paluster TaxID=48578 RepID=UPI001B8698BC|nr:uncharacterized protein EDB91DRAFT_1102913 [Suillus paluster]KAG1752495.1 hypothetical protein EDB91DRAFT_1102913 [Suillus paluster]
MLSFATSANSFLLVRTQLLLVGMICLWISLLHCPYPPTTFARCKPPRKALDPHQRRPPPHPLPPPPRLAYTACLHCGLLVQVMHCLLLSMSLLRRANCASL